MTEAQPRWVRFEIAIEPVDPWTLLPPLQEDGSRLMAWSAPSKEITFVAVGSLMEFRPSGSSRFDEARAWWEPISKQMVSGQTIPDNEEQLRKL